MSQRGVTAPLRPTEPVLRRWYEDDRLSTPIIGRRCDVKKETVNRWLREAGIPRRSYREAQSLAYETGRYTAHPGDPENLKRYWADHPEEKRRQIKAAAAQGAVFRRFNARCIVSCAICGRELHRRGNRVMQNLRMGRQNVCGARCKRQRQNQAYYEPLITVRSALRDLERRSAGYVGARSDG